MAKTTARTGTAPFAHLLALVTGKPVSGKRADDEEKPDENAEEEEPKEPEEEAEEADPKEPEEKKGKRAKAKAKAEDNDSDDEDDEAEGKAEDPDDDEEMAQARREGFLAAQARGRKIFKAASAGLRPDMAAHLAFNENRPSADAITMLDMAATGHGMERGSRIARRMAALDVPNVGTGGSGRKSEEMSFGELAKAAAVKAGILSA